MTAYCELMTLDFIVGIRNVYNISCTCVAKIEKLQLDAFKCLIGNCYYKYGILYLDHKSTKCYICLV